MAHRWIERVLAAPKSVVCVCLVLIVAMALGMQNLYFRGDYRTFFREDNPQRQAYEEMQRVFSKNETANILIASPTGSVFNPTTLELIRSITEDAWQTPFSSRIDSLANFQHTYAKEDDLIVDKLVPARLDLTAEAVARVRDVALNEPDLVGRLVSANERVAMINITVNMSSGDQTLEVNEITTFIRELANRYQAQYPEHSFYHTGIVVLNNAFQEAANDDAATLVPAMFALIIVLIGVMMRSIVAPIVTLVLIAGTITATLGVAGWLGFYLSMSTVNVPTMVMTIAVADCIHIISSYRQALAAGKDKRAAITHSVNINRMPVIITSVTTAIGFLTLNFSDVPILADLGNLNALGVMLACLLALTLLPALLWLLPTGKVTASNQSSVSWAPSLGEWVIKHHRKILPYSLILFVTAMALVTTNQLNDIAIHYFDKNNTFRKAADYQEEQLSGLASIDFAIYTETPSGVNNPNTLAIVHAFSEWLRHQPEVDHVSAITDTYRRLNMNMHNDDPNFYRLPTEQDLAAQYMLLFEMSLPYGLDLNNQLDIDKSATRIMATMANLGSKEFVAFEQRARQWFDQFGEGLRMTAASQALMFAHIGEINMQSMIKGALLALALISVLLVFALKSLRLGLISLVPNLLPAAIGFAIWALISGEINMALSVVISMTLGIIVDDTVHFLTKYQMARKQGTDAADSIRYAFKTVAPALVTTTIVLSLGFGVLTLSAFALNAEMGLLTAIILLCAVAIDLLLLPAFLLWLDRNAASKVAD